MYELGNREPSFDLLQQISKIFNVSVDYLLGNETEIKNNDAISDIVIKLSQNEKFLNTVNLLYNASDEQLNAVESMLLAFK
jgi:transcriptional regulator with XRE-family HTH domain